MNRLMDKEVVLHIFNEIQTYKRIKLCHLLPKLMNLEFILISEINHKHKAKYHKPTLVLSKEDNLMESKKRTAVSLGW